MNRRSFLKRIGVGAISVLIAPKLLAKDLETVKDTTVTNAGPRCGIWGEKTLNRGFSIERDIVFHIRRQFEYGLEVMAFEPNDQIFRNRLIEFVDIPLDVFKKEGTVHGYMIVCDERNNAAETVDEGLVYMDVYYKRNPSFEIKIVKLVARCSKTISTITI